ncbi:MAG: sigma-70 family RNA polymerase sigma factor [Dehalococcoidia bacterium]
MNKGNPRDEYEIRLAGLYEEYYDKIARYAYVRIGNREEAEDIAGEVFLKALKALDSYRDRGVPMQVWLFRIAHNLAVDHLRKMAKRTTAPIESVELLGNDDPADTSEKSLEFERVAEAMKQLTVEQREVISLRFFGGLTAKEVGDTLGKADGAVREMQRAAIEKLRAIMGVQRS